VRAASWRATSRVAAVPPGAPSDLDAGAELAEHAQLSPIATCEGRIVGRNIVDGPKHAPDYADYASIPPASLLCRRWRASGRRKPPRRRKGIDLNVAVSDMREWLSGRAYALWEAWSKVLIDNKTTGSSACTSSDTPVKS
jgi:glutathione reductase (NADPH)